MEGRYASGFTPKASVLATARDTKNPFTTRSERTTSVSWKISGRGMSKIGTLRSARLVEEVGVLNRTGGCSSGMDVEAMDTAGFGAMAKDRAITAEVRVMGTVATEKGKNAKTDTVAITGVNAVAKGIQPTPPTPKTDRVSSVVIRPTTMEVSQYNLRSRGKYIWGDATG